MSGTVSIRKIPIANTPALLQAIPKPPAELYVRGELHRPHMKILTVVGSRNHTTYARDVISFLIRGLAGYPISIVSGLALGIDALAHESALEHGLHTTAVVGSGLAPSVLYPVANRRLADRIIDSGGCLVSEFEPEFTVTQWSFPKRNRIMAGMSDAVLIIEAEYKSGTRITADLALEYGRTVMAVPGSIFSESSRGTNFLIARGAVVVTSPTDILRESGFDTETTKTGSVNAEKIIDVTPPESALLGLLSEPKSRGQLVQESGLDISELTTVITLLEIKGIVREEYGLIRRVF